jgi:NitT/TauT family transport system substrate-binding protein
MFTGRSWRMRFSVVLALVVLATAAACGGSGEESSQGGLKKVSYLSAFGLAGRDSFAWVAQQKGYYKDAGIQVNIQPGSATGENLKAIAGGRVQFAALDMTGAWITAGKTGDSEFRAIAAIHQQSLVSIITLQGSGITKVADLKGKKIGAATGSVNQLLFPAYAKKAGLDPNSVHWVNAAPAQLPALLAGGKVDALSTFFIGQKGIEKAAGKKTVILRYTDYLPDLYGNGIVTTEKLIKSDPDLVKKFREASLKGLRYAIAHPAEAAAILKKAQPAANVAAAIGELTLMKPAVGAAPGAIDRTRVSGELDTLRTAGLIGAKLQPDDLVDFSLTSK